MQPPLTSIATIADAAVLAAIHAAAFPPDECWSQAVFSLHLALAGTTARLHKLGGLIVARVAADEAEILTLAVAPEARLQGVGTALLRDMAVQLSRLNATNLFLEVSVTNHAALILYRHAGFAEVGRRKDYYGPNLDALVMRLPLGANAHR